MKEISEKIKELRKAKKLSQEELAEKIGITQASYFQIEKGKTELSVERLFQIASVLDVSAFDLLDVVNQEKKQSEGSKKVKELEVLVNHWKELAETRNEKIKYLEKHLKGLSDALLEELSSRVFLWLQGNEPDGESVNVKSLKWHNLKTILKVLESDQLKQLYLENLRNSEALDYAIHNGLLGEEGEIIRTAIFKEALNFLQESHENLSSEDLKNLINSIKEKLERFMPIDSTKEKLEPIVN